jgi:arylsulfatase A-like enzyme
MSSYSMPLRALARACLMPLRMSAVVISFLLACAGLAVLGATAHGAEISVNQPNILFIVTDDQRSVGTMDLLNTDGSYWMGGTNFWFRTNGTTFQDGYVPTPLCCPSRASIFTGRYPHNHGVQSDEEGARLGTSATTGQQPTTLQNYLQQAGYTTGMVGKYLNNWDLSIPPPYFNFYATFNGDYGQSAECSTCRLDVNDNGARNTSLAAYSTTWANDKALGFIDAHHGDSNPWFLEVAPYAPHLSAPGGGLGLVAETEPSHSSDPVPDDSYVNHPAASYFEPDGLSDKPPWLRDHPERWTTEDKVVKARRSQLRSLKSVDDMVKNIMRRLQDYGEVRDTLAVFISDNGFLWGEHKIGPPPADGIPGKGEPYPESTKVPFFARWPNAPAGSRFELPKGGTDRRPVTTVDLAATVLDAVNATRSGAPIQPVTPLDGRSLFDRTWLRTRIFTEFWRIDDGVNAADHKANLTIPPWAADRYFKLYATNDIFGQLYQYQFQFNEYYGYVNQAGCEAPSPDLANCAPNYSNPFREYYDAVSDPQETQNAYGGDGKPGEGGDDRSIPNQLPWEYLTSQLATDRTCAGTDYSSGHACP